jgi:Flp pilus assembly protein TadG
MIRKLRCVGGEEGASLVETALASTIFLVMLIGTFQMMLGSYTLHFVSDAAREGTRYAIVRGSTSCTNTPSLSNCNATADQIKAYVRGLKYPGITSSKLTVTTTWQTASTTKPTTWSACGSGTCNAPGNQVKVVATYAFPLSIPFVPKSTFNLTSTSRMVISQ